MDVFLSSLFIIIFNHTVEIVREPLGSDNYFS